MANLGWESLQLGANHLAALFQAKGICRFDRHPVASLFRCFRSRYGTASYLRLKDNAGHIHCSLVFAKSRVAPLKTITIPRMELTAASVSAKLHKFLEEQLYLPIHRSIFWTDTTIVLQYGMKPNISRYS